MTNCHVIYIMYYLFCVYCSNQNKHSKKGSKNEFLSLPNEYFVISSSITFEEGFNDIIERFEFHYKNSENELCVYYRSNIINDVTKRLENDRILIQNHLLYLFNQKYNGILDIFTNIVDFNEREIECNIKETSMYRINFSNNSKECVDFHKMNIDIFIYFFEGFKEEHYKSLFSIIDKLGLTCGTSIDCANYVFKKHFDFYKNVLAYNFDFILNAMRSNNVLRHHKILNCFIDHFFNEVFTKFCAQIEEKCIFENDLTEFYRLRDELIKREKEKFIEFMFRIFKNNESDPEIYIINHNNIHTQCHIVEKKLLKYLECKKSIDFETIFCQQLILKFKNLKKNFPKKNRDAR